MRLGQAIFFGSAAALLTLAAPTLARNSNATPHAPKVIEAIETPASTCQAYQQTADGTWAQLPCQEMGSRTPVPTHAAEGAVEERR